MSLHPCPQCGRHVRRTESSCPFCSASLSFEGIPERGVPTVRLGRAATMAFGAAAVVGASALTGCVTPVYGGPPPADANTADAYLGSVDAAYGGPPVDAAQADAGPDVDANADTGPSIALYGGAPPP